MPGAQFFPNARLNFAGLLRHSGSGDAIAFRGEDKVKRRQCWDALNAELGRFHRFLEDAGIVAGDRVAGILPNMPESIVSALGTAAIGAVWSSCSPNQLTAEAEAAQSLGTGHATHQLRTFELDIRRLQFVHKPMKSGPMKRGLIGCGGMPAVRARGLM
jgi:acyl-CoA synthetase (AMP-forming)/AMP-acid ligase II